MTLRAFNPMVGVWISALGMVAHAFWAYLKSSGAPLSAGGAFIIVVGVLTIARSLIRLGDQKVMRAGRTVVKQVREIDGQLVSANPDEDREQYQDARAELQFGPALVIVGTIINGYGAILGDCLFAAQGCLLR